MAQQPGFRPHPGAQVPGWQARPPVTTPSGLFPAGPARSPDRPTYREPHPIRAAGVFAGGASAAVWLLAFGLLADDLRGYVLWTVFAGGVAWLVALGLTRFGDRGVATGLALVTGVGWALAGTAVAIRWASSADWPLW